MVLSQNGWVANDPSLTANYTIGNGRIVRLRRGDAGYLLKHYADWFDAHIEDIDQGADDWGYAERNIRGSDTTVSNHASGTALDLNATKHPLGVRGTFSDAKTSAIRQHLKLYGGVLRWGGDYENRPDEMHVEINANAAEVGRVATIIRAGAAKPVEKPHPQEDPVLTKVRAIVARIKANLYNPDRHLVDLDDLEQLIALGHQPQAAAAKAFRDQVKAGATAFGTAVKW